MLPSEIDSGGGSLKTKTLGLEDLDETGIFQSLGKKQEESDKKNKAVFMNLVNIDEKAQV